PWVVPLIPQAHVALHRLRVAGRELSCRPLTAGQVERSEYLHDLRRLLGQDLYSEVAGTLNNIQLPHPKPLRVDSDTSSAVRPSGDFVSVSREPSVRLPGV